MTHMNNYANDRLGLYVFNKLFEFMSKWTNLKFVSLEPVQMAEKYFQMYPQDAEPRWTNACKDKRHVSLWHLNKTNCDKFPKLIIIGPQKTGD